MNTNRTPGIKEIKKIGNNQSSTYTFSEWMGCRVLDPFPSSIAS
jgi:hypothetical protein